MTFNARRTLLGTVIGLAGHLLPFAAGFIAGRVVQPSVGGGFEDVAAVALAFIGAEVLLLIGVVIAFIRLEKDLARGVALGWLLGIVALVTFLNTR